MQLLLPPSETKREGGDASRPLELAALGFPRLAPMRRTAIAELRKLSRSRVRSNAALGLGPQLAFEVERNRTLGSSPTMPALERYTGVLFDALDVSALSDAARTMATDTVVIHSALFGLLRASDPIPAYRLSHDSKLPDARLKALWARPISRELEVMHGLVVDMRSEAYVGLGPLDTAENRVFLKVVTEAADGTRRAVNHFNKRGKGEFVRKVLESDIRHPSVESMLEWAAEVGIRLERGAPGEVMLIVDEILAARRS